jgi:hypothetical protein
MVSARGFSKGRLQASVACRDVLGPVHTCMVVATEVIFSQDQAARTPCSYSTPASANAGLRENGPVPSGCAANPAMRRCSSFIWNNQTSLLAPCLAGFATATRRSYKCEQALVEKVRNARIPCCCFSGANGTGNPVHGRSLPTHLLLQGVTTNCVKLLNRAYQISVGYGIPGAGGAWRLAQWLIRCAGSG